MKRLLRRIRGALGIGLAWAFAWFAAGMVLLFIVGPDAADVPFPLGFGALGFVAGVTFSGVLGLMEGRRSFDQMSLPRFAGWGALGGLLFSVAFVSAVAIFAEGPSFLWNLTFLGPIFAGVVGVSAVGSLAIARAGDDGSLLATGEEMRDAAFSKEEAQDLLGG
jgi:hypothetical protein